MKTLSLTITTREYKDLREKKLLASRSSETLNKITLETCEALLGGMGLEAHHVSSKEAREIRSDGRIAIIGFGGESMRGTLVLDIPAKVLARSHPRRSEVESDLEDWAGEVANLLLGRIKARLLRFGVAIQLSTPMVVRGTGTRIEQSTDHSVVHTFVADEGTFHVLFAADAEEELMLGDEPPRDAAVEGDTVDEMVMF